MTKSFKYICGILIICLSLAMSTPVYAAKVSNTAYIYIGDSRTVGLNAAINLSDLPNTFVVATIREEHPEYTDWVYIFNLGVNDLNNVDKYCELIPVLEKEATLYYVSINPTVDAVGGVQCAEIDSFNTKIMKVATNYIDSYSDNSKKRQ